MMPKTLYIMMAALALSCAAGPDKHEENAKVPGLKCGPDDQASAHAAIATRANLKNFSGCFKNYLKHNPKSQRLSVKFCAHIKTDSQGNVRKASLQDGIFNGETSSLPNDLRWCLEQQLWQLNYSGLQFDSPKLLSFPLAFEVRI